MHLPLPTTTKTKVLSEGINLSAFFLPKRYRRLILSCFLALGTFYVLDTSDLLNGRPDNTADEHETLVPYPEEQYSPPINDPDYVSEDGSWLPPTHDAYRLYEDLLSERHLQSLESNSTSQTINPKYIYFANHVVHAGWGNALQEMVFNALLAEKAGLGYVWNDYTWDSTSERYSEFNGKAIPARIPISTMLGGYFLGQFEDDTHHITKNDTTVHPKAISYRVYQSICPQEDRVLINRNIIQEYLNKRSVISESEFADTDLTSTGIDLNTASGKEILDACVEVLTRTEKYKNATCIEVEKNTLTVFDIWLFGSPRIQSLWPTLSQSLLMKNWQWAPLITRAFTRNLRHFVPEDNLLLSNALISPKDEPTSMSLFHNGILPTIWNIVTTPIYNLFIYLSHDEPIPKPTIRPPSDNASLPVLALHIRRGDFSEHCENLAEWGSLYNGFNSFPESRERDKFDVPLIVSKSERDSDDSGEEPNSIDPEEVSSTDERKRVYAKHCFPDIEQIVKRVKEIMRDYRETAAIREWEELERKQMEEQIRNRKSWWMHWSGRINTERVGAHTDSNSDSGMSMEVTIIRKESAKKRPKGLSFIKKIYIMTNADPAWLEELKAALVSASRSTVPGCSLDEALEWDWESISTSRDLDLGWEEKPVGQALDMYVAQRAEVFVGNGFSSLTSNIVMLRMREGFEAVQTRFW